MKKLVIYTPIKYLICYEDMWKASNISLLLTVQPWRTQRWWLNAEASAPSWRAWLTVSWVASTKLWSPPSSIYSTTHVPVSMCALTSNWRYTNTHTDMNSEKAAVYKWASVLGVIPVRIMSRKVARFFPMELTVISYRDSLKPHCL